MGLLQWNERLDARGASRSSTVPVKGQAEPDHSCHPLLPPPRQNHFHSSTCRIYSVFSTSPRCGSASSLTPCSISTESKLLSPGRNGSLYLFSALPRRSQRLCVTFCSFFSSTGNVVAVRPPNASYCLLPERLKDVVSCLLGPRKCRLVRSA